MGDRVCSSSSLYQTDSTHSVLDRIVRRGTQYRGHNTNERDQKTFIYDQQGTVRQIASALLHCNYIRYDNTYNRVISTRIFIEDARDVSDLHVACVCVYNN